MMNGKKTAAKKPAAAKKTATKKYAMGGGVASPFKLANAAAQFQQQQSMKSSSSPQAAGGMMGQAPTAAQRALLGEGAASSINGIGPGGAMRQEAIDMKKYGNQPSNARLARSVAVGRPNRANMKAMAKGGAVTKKPVATKGKKK